VASEELHRFHHRLDCRTHDPRAFRLEELRDPFQILQRALRVDRFRQELALGRARFFPASRERIQPCTFPAA
jgi:hypothetical protein